MPSLFARRVNVVLSGLSLLTVVYAAPFPFPMRQMLPELTAAQDTCSAYIQQRYHLQGSTQAPADAAASFSGVSTETGPTQASSPMQLSATFYMTRKGRVIQSRSFDCTVSRKGPQSTVSALTWQGKWQPWPTSKQP